ncbi:MBL fold metallo-hydrolase [Azospirillum canadense]|uniref:MBL fold metallo-hydrolase n=1 Tax=Azospirillum canadense TaxID=403962 RepID=UPI0022261391|nr:MBL fold metallo-hydrolase [Azospirillum canadense]MCW2239077.1 glyoxylase-like metal-dependent hydrolase (beta-lactamase superfamily II) [Azospirillum canadense]
MIERHALSAPGNWYIDTRCIDCSAACTLAPGLIVARGGQSVFARQPLTAEERLQAWRARLACPTASVRTECHEDVPTGAFPEPMTEGVDRLGYNARSSYGAHAFLIRRPAGNLMVDAPRWTPAVVRPLENRGGVSDVLLTHRDDVGDAERYARHFGARVWIHEADRDAAPFADHVICGAEPVGITEELLAIPVPGHTAGSVVYLCDERFLFTGDSLAWSFEHNDLTAWREVCWWSWPDQLRSLRRLLSHRFEWVFAGHGGSHCLPFREMRARLAALLERLE